jgi:hypothetical protein
MGVHFPVYGRVHGHASVDYPGIYPRSTLRYGYRTVLESGTISLVTPPLILWGEALMAQLALYARVTHSPRHEYALRERNLGHLSVTRLCPEQTRVRRFLTVLLPPRVNTDPTRPVVQTASSSQAHRTLGTVILSQLKGCALALCLPSIE